MSAPFNGAKALLDADSGDIDFLFLGDSTGETSSEWVGHFMWLLHYYYPSFTVSYSEWYNGGSLSWSTPATIYSGSGANTARFWVAGDSGAGCDYYTSREVAIIQHPTDVDFCAIALGHNTTRGESDFNALVEMVESNWPSAHITMVKENPRYDNFSLGETTAATVGAVASTYDTGLVDIRARFLNDPDPQTNLMGDDVHPNDLGRRVWGETAWLALHPQGGFPVATLDDAVWLLQAKNYSGSGDWLDESGNGLDATITNAVFSTGDSVVAQPHFRFDGNGDYMKVSDNSLLDIGANESATILIVVAADSPSNRNDFWLDKGGITGAAQGGWRIASYSSDGYVGVAAYVLGGAGYGSVTPAEMQANTLHVLALVRDHVAGDLTAFIDGSPDATPATTPGSSDLSSAEDVTIGARTNPTNYGWAQGRVVAIAKWSTALTDAEVAAMGALLANPKKLPLATTFAPVARW